MTTFLSDYEETDPRMADALPRPAAPRLAVCIPARDEERAVGNVVEAALAATTHGLGAVGEVVVVVDGSTDSTAAAATAAGARVVSSDALGKGHAMRQAIAATTADIMIFVDADVTGLESSHITALAEPLVRDHRAMLVKPRYRRALYGHQDEGGRVTELVARPLLQLFWPSLADLSQPLAGESAIRRPALDTIELPDDYAVELALLLDVYARYGWRAIAEVDLGERIHRNRPLRDLTPQARSIIAMALSRRAASSQRTRALPAPHSSAKPVALH